MEHLIKLSEAHGDHEIAAELREQLNRSRVRHLEEPSEPAYTEPEKPQRKQRKKPAPSSDKKLREAWREVDDKRGRT
jgi:hypothetical protein